jgi:drug/metabolite transporter (DMT)-like permease
MRRTGFRAIAAAACFLLLFRLTPPDDPRFRLCPYHWLTGRDCPLCGLTRALCALAKGHWSQAVHFNALSPLAAVMLAAFLIGRPAPGRWWTAGLAMFGLYGVCRLLAPGV